MTPTAVDSNLPRGYLSSTHGYPISSSTNRCSATNIRIGNCVRKAPDSKALHNAQINLQSILTKATQRAVIAERSAVEYLKAKEDLERQLTDHHVTAATLLAPNNRLTAEATAVTTTNEELTASTETLQKHTKNCEKAIHRAQKQAQHAKGHAEHLIRSQKGQLSNAERRYEGASQELKEWRERYGSVEALAAEKAALQKRVADWQSEAEKALSEIAKIKGGSQRQQGSIEAGETVTSITVEGETGSTDPATHPGLAVAEAQAAQYKQERDTLRRLQGGSGTECEIGGVVGAEECQGCGRVGGIGR